MPKGPKDPNGPTRPKSAFLAWRVSNYQNVAKGMAVGHSFKELQAKFGTLWKTMTAEEKGPYEDAAKIEWEKYHKLQKAYKQTSSYAAFQKVKKQHKVDDVKKAKFRKDENAPKKPLTAYFMFLGDKRASAKTQYPDLNHKELVKKLGTMWTALSETEKKSYADQAAAGKKEYQVKLNKYKQSEEYQTYQAEKAEFLKNKKGKLSRAKKRAMDDDEKDEDYTSVKRPRKKAKKSSKKAKKSSKKPKAPKSKAKKASKAKKKKSSKKKGGKKPRKAKASKAK